MKSVVVCGSKKYKREIAEFCKRLAALNVLVFEPSIQQPIPEDSFFHSEYVTAKLFKGLTLEHFDWIRKAEVCYIYNKDDYAGVSVTMEMAYAAALGKPIFALTPPNRRTFARHAYRQSRADGRATRQPVVCHGCCSRTSCRRAVCGSLSAVFEHGV